MKAVEVFHATWHARLCREERRCEWRMREAGGGWEKEGKAPVHAMSVPVHERHQAKPCRIRRLGESQL